MYWSEKIDILTKRYNSEEFSIPSKSRKRILRSIESKFIQRPKDYYDLNNSNERFSNWWENVKDPNCYILPNSLDIFLEKLLVFEESFWIASEFVHGNIWIYKSQIQAAQSLIASGRSWADIYHIIGIKYEYFFSLNFEKEYIIIRKSGVGDFDKFDPHLSQLIQIEKTG